MFHMWTDAYLQCTSATRLSADLHSKRSKCSHSMYVQQSRCTLSYPLKIYWRLKKDKDQQWWSYGRISSDLGSFVSATRYLHVSGQTYGRPIAGQYEVSATATESRGNLWQAMVCVCFSLHWVMSQCDVIMTSLMGHTKAGIMIQICYTMHVEPLAIVCQVIGVP